MIESSNLALTLMLFLTFTMIVNPLWKLKI